MHLTLVSWKTIHMLYLNCYLSAQICVRERPPGFNQTIAMKTLTMILKYNFVVSKLSILTSMKSFSRYFCKFLHFNGILRVFDLDRVYFLLLRGVFQSSKEFKVPIDRLVWSWGEFSSKRDWLAQWILRVFACSFINDLSLKKNAA